MYVFKDIASPSARIILTLSIILFAGFFMTRITKRLRLPNVSGYILAGVFIGPYVLHLVSEEIVQQMDFVTDIALAFIAFGVGKYFKLSHLRENGIQVIIITLLEALLSFFIVTAAMIFIFHLPVSFSLLLGAIASATAPASTIMTIRQYKAKGPFVTLLLQIVALDDAVALLAFSVCAAIAGAISSGSQASFTMIYMPILYNIAALLLGGFCGWLLHLLANGKRSAEHRLSLLIGILLTITGVCAALNISPLLSCMLCGMVYINTGGNKQLFKQLNKFTPPVFMTFFVVSGMKLNLSSLAVAGGIGVAYFVIRIAGKYIGAYLGTLLCRCPKDIRCYLGLALIPQAGVSIGLAALGQRILPGDWGILLSTIILSSGLLYEMIGPACAKLSLFLSHSIPDREKQISEKKKVLPVEKHKPA